MVKLCDLLFEFGLDFTVDEIILMQNASWWPIQNAEQSNEISARISPRVPEIKVQPQVLCATT